MVKIEQSVLIQPTLNQQPTLHKGQILNGQISKLLKNQFAIVKIGGVIYTAKLESPMQAGEYYWFQVKTQRPTLTLQLLTPKGNNTGKIGDHVSLMIIKQLGILETSLTKKIVSYFSNHKLPISKDLINQATQLLNDVNIENGLPIIKRMINQQFPLKESIFQPLLTYDQNPSIAEFLTLLENGLLPFKNKLEPVRKLLMLLEQWSSVDYGNEPATDNMITPHTLFNVLKLMGFDFERDIGHYLQKQEPDEKFVNLKAMLLDIGNQKEISLATRELISKTIDVITGHQLHNIDQGNNSIQLVYTLPIRINEEYTDLKLVWEGKKGKNGKIDQEHCRIIFYVTLNYIKETSIQIYVFKNKLSIQIYNEAGITLAPLITKFSSILKEKLTKLNFTVSSISQVNNPPSYVSKQTAKANTMMDVKV